MLKVKNDLRIDDFSSRTLSVVDRENWVQFVKNNFGNYCHSLEWQQVLRVAYQLETNYLMILDGETPIGIFPLALIPILFLSKSVSLPYCNYGGLLVSKYVDKNKVLQATLAYLSKQGINQVEIRELCSSEGSRECSELALILDLPETCELLWKTIGSKIRNQIRKAERAGLVVRWGQDQVDDLYDIYADNMGRLGTPVHARTFIEEILKAFGERADILTVSLEGKAVAAMLVLKHGDTWIDPIASSRIEYNHVNPNMFLYWEALCQATIAKAKYFDFGRSKKKSGTYHFKRQWGAKEFALDYHSYVDGIRVDAASTDLYRGGKAALFAKIWTKVPRFVQRFMGPKIRRYIP